MQIKATFNPLDPLRFESQLHANEIKLMNRAREFAQKQIAPTVNEAFREQSLFVEAVKKMGDNQLLGGDIEKKYGGPEMNAICYGLIARELERVDSGYRTLFSVMSGLVMHAIHAFGSEVQKQLYLPRLAKSEIIGSFGLTEPEHGSDPSGLETHVKEIAGGYLLNGHKRWIGLAPFADIFIIWAKDEESIVRGFIVDSQLKGIETPLIEGKVSLRTAPQGEIIMRNVKLPENSILPQSAGLASPFSCLNHARYGIAWGVLGAAEECLQRALEYTLQRKQFKRPLAANQLIQKKLVDMQVEIAFCLQACLRVGRCIDDGVASHEMISIIKRDCTSKALHIARQARDILGANGILDEYAVMRHLVNLEAVNTYEGTEDIHTLILGRALTGIAAFT